MKATVGVLYLLLLLGFNNASFVQFGNMIKAKSRVPPLAYNGYGNYCGMFGKGREMDNIDRCCSAHDKCLSVTNRRHCLPFFYLAYYLLPYRWYMRDGRIECSSSNIRCTLELCKCDKLCAECFARYEHQYDPDLKRRTRIG